MPLLPLPHRLGRLLRRRHQALRRLPHQHLRRGLTRLHGIAQRRGAEKKSTNILSGIIAVQRGEIAPTRRFPHRQLPDMVSQSRLSQSGPGGRGPGFPTRRNDRRHTIADTLRNAQLGGAGSLALFRQGHLCCQRWCLVYAGGGFDGLANQVHNDLLRFDLTTNSWSSLAPSPDQHFLSQAVIFDGKIYNIGGFDGTGGSAPPPGSTTLRAIPGLLARRFQWR